MNYIDKEKRKTGGKFLYPYFNRHSLNSLINNAAIGEILVERKKLSDRFEQRKK